MKSRFRRMLLIAAAAAVGLAVGMTLAMRLGVPAPAYAFSLWGSGEKGGAASKPVQPAAQPPAVRPDFVTLAEELSPSVVNISTTQVVKGIGSPFGPEDPFRDFWKPFERFFGQRSEPFSGGQFKRQSLGSGFVLSHFSLFSTVMFSKSVLPPMFS